jgi:hypothetical protein
MFRVVTVCIVCVRFDYVTRIVQRLYEPRDTIHSRTEIIIILAQLLMCPVNIFVRLFCFWLIRSVKSIRSANAHVISIVYGRRSIRLLAFNRVNARHVRTAFTFIIRKQKPTEVCDIRNTFPLKIFNAE